MTTREIFVFVLMPFDGQFDDIYKLGIKEVAEKMGIRAERVDEQIYSEGILERIYQQIDAADIIVADMSDQNPNVFYEVGYAHAKEKLCILLTQKASDIPFDLKHRRHIVYSGSIQTLQKNLKRDFEWAVKEVENIKSSRIKVILSSALGDLKKAYTPPRLPLILRLIFIMNRKKQLRILRPAISSQVLAGLSIKTEMFVRKPNPICRVSRKSTF